MKTFFFLDLRIVLILGFIIQGSLVTQSQTEWKVNGNNVTGDSKLGTNTGYDLIFETGNVERIRLTDDGKFGLGISSPQYPLDVFGDMRLDGSIYLPNFAANSTEERKYLFVDEYGRVDGKTLRGGSGGGTNLLQDIYGVECFPFTNIDGTVTAYSAPTWASVGGDQVNDSKLTLGLFALHLWA